eukprot:scaffold1.g5431.t1
MDRLSPKKGYRGRSCAVCHCTSSCSWRRHCESGGSICNACACRNRRARTKAALSARRAAATPRLGLSGLPGGGMLLGLLSGDELSVASMELGSSAGASALAPLTPSDLASASLASALMLGAAPQAALLAQAAAAAAVSPALQLVALPGGWVAVPVLLAPAPPCPAPRPAPRPAADVDAAPWSAGAHDPRPVVRLPEAPTVGAAPPAVPCPAEARAQALGSDDESDVVDWPALFSDPAVGPLARSLFL